jgi:uncharacterized protein with PQ loop repeat
MTEAIGWLSSLVLLLTISTQVHRQWKAGSSQGVSHWLFLGQTTASAGFTVYSLLVRDWVFVVTNALLVVSALTGWLIVLKHRRQERRRSRPAPLRSAPGARGSAPSAT